MANAFSKDHTVYQIEKMMHEKLPFNVIGKENEIYSIRKLNTLLLDMIYLPFVAFCIDSFCFMYHTLW